MAYLYRGVHAEHPRIGDARMGIAIPGQLDGKVTPNQHNEGGYSHSSPYTSWTTSLTVARKHAYNDKHAGVVLRVVDDRDRPGEQKSTWKWIDSRDIFGEGEVLLHGIRTGIEVLEP